MNPVYFRQDLSANTVKFLDETGLKWTAFHANKRQSRGKHIDSPKELFIIDIVSGSVIKYCIDIYVIMTVASSPSLKNAWSPYCSKLLSIINREDVVHK